MADKFRVGQRVRVIKTHHTHVLIGQITTILSSKHSAWTQAGLYEAYTVDIQPPEGYLEVVLPEDWMEPVYDGDEKSSWGECAWKPKLDVLQPSQLVPTNK